MKKPELSCLQVLQTSAAGDKLTDKAKIRFKPGLAGTTPLVQVQPRILKQTIQGIGTSFTESSAFVLAHLPSHKRFEVMKNIFGEQGANFSMARTPIGSTDFSVEGRFCYAEVAQDNSLAHFSIAVDQDGFDVSRYPDIKDPNFDLLPMIQQALNIKSHQPESDLKIIASAWTAPPWMKDINDWYQSPGVENSHQGKGGSLRDDCAENYAEYLVKYLDAYYNHGVDIWGLTPVNEPLGNNGQWESMEFSAESQREFIKQHLGPKLQYGGFGDVELLILDHSRTHLEEWADEIYSDADCTKFVSGAAVHWYESSFKVYEDVLQRVHEKYPDFKIIHTEGCIDDLGKDAPAGITDPVGYKESGWFDNDDFWWHNNASDWAYSATWAGVNAEDHPIYTPAHRYARNIIVSMNHWVSGWIDWNIVLDRNGGPNHVGNFCGAPIMIDISTGYVYYTPIYYLLAQFSRTIRPGNRAVQSSINLGALDTDAMHACATINSQNQLSVQVLNTTEKQINYALQVGDQYACTSIDANALQTIGIQL